MEEANCELEEAETREQPTIYFRLDFLNTAETGPNTKVCKWFAIPPRGVNVDTNGLSRPPKERDTMVYKPVVGFHIFIISGGVEYTSGGVPIRLVRYINTQSEEKKWGDGPTLEKAPNLHYNFVVDGKIYALGMYGYNLFSLHCLNYHTLEEGWMCLLAKEESDDYDHSPVSSFVVAHTIEYEAVTDSTTGQPMRCAQRAIIVTNDGMISYNIKKNEIYMYPNDVAGDDFGLSTCGVCHNGLMYLLSGRYEYGYSTCGLSNVACFDVEKEKWRCCVRGFEKYDNALPKPDNYICDIPSFGRRSFLPFMGRQWLQTMTVDCTGS